MLACSDLLICAVARASRAANKSFKLKESAPKPSASKPIGEDKLKLADLKFLLTHLDVNL